MTNFKNQQKKLLTTDIAGKIMDPFVGLNEIHEALIRRKAEKSVKKLVKEYYSAVKFQAREVKEQIKNEKKQQQAAGLSPAGQDSETNLLAS